MLVCNKKNWMVVLLFYAQALSLLMQDQMPCCASRSVTSSLTESLIFGYNIQENTPTNNYQQYSVTTRSNQNTALF